MREVHVFALLISLIAGLIAYGIWWESSNKADCIEQGAHWVSGNCIQTNN